MIEGHRFVEFAVQFRIGDLLHIFKKRPDKLLGINIPIQVALKVGSKVVQRELLFGAVLDRTDDDHPFMTIRCAEEDVYIPPQVIALQFTFPQFGGWSAKFLCPGVRDDGSRCGKTITCLYLPAPYTGRQFACRDCNHLLYVNQVRRNWKSSATSRRKKKTEEPQFKPRKAPRGRDFLPIKRPTALWYSEIPPYTPEERFLFEVRGTSYKSLNEMKDLFDLLTTPVTPDERVPIMI